MNDQQLPVRPQMVPADPFAPQPALENIPTPTVSIPTPVPPPKKEMAPPMPTLNFPEVKASVSEADKIAAAEGDEYWQKFAKEIEIEKEIAEMGGVEKIASGEVAIPEAIAKEMGVKPAITIETPLTVAKEFSTREVSLTDDQLASGSKKPTSSGFRWLVEWFILQLKKAHYLIKFSRGRITRQPPAPAVGR